MAQSTPPQDVPLDLSVIAPGSARSANCDDVNHDKKNAEVQENTPATVNTTTNPAIPLPLLDIPLLDKFDDFGIGSGAFKPWSRSQSKHKPQSPNDFQTSSHVHSRASDGRFNDPQQTNLKNEHPTLNKDCKNNQNFHNPQFLSDDWLSKPSPWSAHAQTSGIARPIPTRHVHSRPVPRLTEQLYRQQTKRSVSKSFVRPYIHSSTHTSSAMDNYLTSSLSPRAKSTRHVSSMTLGRQGNNNMDGNTHSVFMARSKSSNLYLRLPDDISEVSRSQKLGDSEYHKFVAQSGHSKYVSEFFKKDISKHQHLSILRRVKKSRKLLRNRIRRESNGHFSVKPINKENRESRSYVRSYSMAYHNQTQSNSHTIPMSWLQSHSPVNKSHTVKPMKTCDNRQIENYESNFGKQENNIKPMDLTKPKYNIDDTLSNVCASDLNNYEMNQCSNSNQSYGPMDLSTHGKRECSNEPQKKSFNTAISKEMKVEIEMKAIDSCRVATVPEDCDNESMKHKRHFDEKESIVENGPGSQTVIQPQHKKLPVVKKTSPESSSCSPLSSSDDSDCDLPVTFGVTANMSECPLPLPDSATTEKLTSLSRDGYQCEDCKAHCLSFFSLLQHQRLGCLNKSSVDMNVHAYNCPLLFKKKQQGQNCECTACPKCRRIFKSGFSVFSHYQRGCYGFIKNQVSQSKPGSSGFKECSPTYLGSSCSQSCFDPLGREDQNSGKDASIPAPRQESACFKYSVSTQREVEFAVSHSSVVKPSDKNSSVMSIESEGKNVTLRLQTAVAYGSSMTSRGHGDKEKVIYLLDAHNKPIMLVEKRTQEQLPDGVPEPRTSHGETDDVMKEELQK